MDAKVQENPVLEDMDGNATMGNLLMILQSEEADLLDKVLLEMLVEDVQHFLEGGVSNAQFEDTWAVLEGWKFPAFLSASLGSLPKLVTSPEITPASHHKFALNLLAVMVTQENIFTHLEAQHKEVLSALVHACEGLDVNAVLCLPLAAVISACLRHTAGRQWSENTGVWCQLVAAVAASGGGRFRPALSRLLIGRLAQLWAEPVAVLTGPLQAVSSFLVVPTRRLIQPLEEGSPAAWFCCCELLLQLVQQLLQEPAGQHKIAQTEQHRQLLTALAEQVAVPMDLAPAPFVPAQLFVGLHLLNQSASEATVTSAVQRACRALSRQTGKAALRGVTSVLLDSCLLGGARCCHLSAVAAAPVWSALHRWRAAELTPQESALADAHRKIVEEFVAGDCHLSEVQGISSSDRGPLEGTADLDLVRKVFLSRADRPCRAAPGPTALCPLLQPWVLVLKHGLLRQPRLQADVLSLMANLCGPTDVTVTGCDGDVTSLVGLEHVICDLLQDGEVTERVAVCVLVCLSRCSPLLPPPSGDPVWVTLAALLTSRLTQPEGEDSMDAAGEAVLSLVRTANHRARTERTTNQETALLPPTNGSAGSAQPTNENAACPLADWLWTNRLASAALTSLLKAGPGSRRVAHWLVEEAAGPVWSDIEQNTDLTQLLESGMDGDVVLDTTPLLYLRRRLLTSSPPSSPRLSPADWTSSALPLLQTALLAGDPAVRRAARSVYLTAVNNDLSSGAPVTAQTAASWLTDGACRALLSPSSPSPYHGDGGQGPAGADLAGPDPDHARRLRRRVVRLLSGETDAESNDVIHTNSDITAGDEVVRLATGELARGVRDRLDPGGLEAVRRLCGESCDHSAGGGTVSRDSGAVVEEKSRDDGVVLDSVSRDAVISSVLAQSTEEFFGGRVGGGGGGTTRLRRRPEVEISLSDFLATAAAADSAIGKVTETTVVPPVPETERREALVRRVAARVEEVFRCATMDRKTEIPTDCY